MSKYMSDQNRTCYQFESGTYAVVSGNRQWLGLVQDSSGESNMNVMQIRYQGSTDRNVDDFADGMKEYNGTISYYPQDWKMLGYAIGSIQDVSGTATGIGHIFSETNSDDRVQVSNSPLYHFTVEDSKNTGTAGSNFVRTVNGAVIDEFTINYNIGEIVTCDMNYIAQSEILNSGTGAVVVLGATTTKPFTFNNVKLEIPEGTLVDNLRGGTFKVSNSLERGNYLNGSRVSAELLPGNRDYESTATCVMDSANAKTFYDSYYIAGSEFNGMLKCWGVAGSLTLVMSGCKMTDMTVPSPLEGVQEQSFTFVPSHITGSVFDTTVKYNAW